MKWILVILITVFQVFLEIRDGVLRQTPGESCPPSGPSNVINFETAKQRILEKRRAVNS